MVVNEKATIHVIDPDPHVSQMLRLRTDPAHRRVRSHTSVRSFRRDYEPGLPACILVDLRTLGSRGVQFMESLCDEAQTAPVIIHTHRNGTDTIVRMIQAGAFDFLVKPVDPRRLLSRIEAAIEENRRRRNSRPISSSSRAHAHHIKGGGTSTDPDNELPAGPPCEMGATLTPRLQQTLQCLIHGETERHVAGELGLSHYTVHDYVKIIYKHFGVRSRAELVARYFQAAEAEHGKRSYTD